MAEAARSEVSNEAVRRILHCDMDCFYAAIHMRDDPALRGKAVLIGGSPDGRGVVAAASYEARRFGVHSAMPSARARRLCPQAVFIKPEFPRYRAESEAIFAIFREITPVVQAVSIDEAYLDVSEQWPEWGSATAIAEEVRRRVREERDLTVSVGVGPNRLIAKIASDACKPDGLSVVRPERVLHFLAPLSVRSLPGVGPATEKTLNKLGIETIADLRKFELDELERRFGRWGKGLYNRARGIDERPVRVHRERKSISCERTYATDLEELSEMDAQLDKMAERIAAGLAKRELTARTVTVKVRYGDFTTITRSHTLRAPTAAAARIADEAKRLMRQSEAGRRSVRLLGVGAANLVRGNVEQLELFGEELG